MAEHVLREPVFELLDEIRTLWARTHERHLTTKHVPELREFVELGLADEPAGGRDAGIVVARVVGGRSGRNLHAAELPESERRAFAAGAGWRVEDRPPEREKNDDGSEQHEWRKHDQAEDTYYEIECTFCQTACPG